MFPYKSIIDIDKKSDTPVFVQVANSFAREIRNGVLKAGTKLPGARTLGELIKVNRNTVAAVYEELSLQGYVELHERKGAFVSARIPDIKPKPIDASRNIPFASKAGYRVTEKDFIPLIRYEGKSLLEFNDGLPDERLAPLDDLARAQRALWKRGRRSWFSYTEVEGNPLLRKEISAYLNETRGMQTTPDNVMIIRGSQMGIFLSAQVLLNSGDIVVTGKTNYHAADLAFQYAGAKIVRVRVDERGLDTDELERLLKKKSIRAVYVTPHHHFPTTVTMSACRRMKLLALAEKYRFAILEDDYDYDFHYNSSPILPLASADHTGMVISIGSMSKSFSPALRIAFLAAPENVIQAISRVRSIVDRQGDYFLEQALAELFREGVIKRHLRKALNAYHERRDVLANQLRQKLSEQVSFEVPAGGLAIWVNFRRPVDLKKLSVAAAKHGLILNDGTNYNPPDANLNSTRLGFASLNPKELEKAVSVLEQCIREM